MIPGTPEKVENTKPQVINPQLLTGSVLQSGVGREISGAHHEAVSWDKGHAFPCSLVKSTAAATGWVFPHDTWDTLNLIKVCFSNKNLLLLLGMCFTVCAPTCRGQHIHPLQAVLAWRRVVAALWKAALAVVQHGSWRDNSRGRDFAHLKVHFLYFLFLIDLQINDLCQVSGVKDDTQKDTHEDLMACLTRFQGLR